MCINVSTCVPVSLLVSALEKGVGREAVCMFYCVLNFKVHFLINTFWRGGRLEGIIILESFPLYSITKLIADYKQELHFFMVVSQMDHYEHLKYISCLSATCSI